VTYIMPRTARKKSESSTYHIMLRGINRQSIFEDAEDFERFVEILRLNKKECGYRIYAWCLMGNHVHLVIRFGEKTPESCMKRIEIAYAVYYNRKYGRTGHLMQDRFKSEVIESDSYLYTVVRYVHQNPVKAGLCRAPEEYVWSSYRQYLADGGAEGIRSRYHLADTKLVLGMYGFDGFVSFTNAANDDECLEMEEPYHGRRKSDEEARRIMKEVTGCENASEFQRLSLPQRRDALCELYEAKLNVLQISRLTGIARTVIYHALRG